jgi:hypothetical protein
MRLVLFVGFQCKYWCTPESPGCTFCHRAQSSVENWLKRLCSFFGHFLTCLLNHNAVRNPAFIFLEQVAYGMNIQAFVILYRLLEWPIDPFPFQLHLYSWTIWCKRLVRGVPFQRQARMLLWLLSALCPRKLWDLDAITTHLTAIEHKSLN